MFVNKPVTDVGMLALYERGAERLAVLGKTREFRLLVDPTFLVDAHTMTCVLASRRWLTPRERTDLVKILDLLAAIFPILVKTGPLPNWEDFQSDGTENKAVRQIYERALPKTV